MAHIFGRTKKKSFHSIRIDSIAARLSAVSLNQFEKSIKYFQVCASASFHRSTGGWPKVPAGTFAHLIPSCGRSDLTDKEKRSQNGKPSGKKPPTEKKKPKTKRQFIYSNLFSFRWKILHNDSANNSRGCKFVCAVDLSPWPYFLCVSRNMCVCRIDFSTTTTTTSRRNATGISKNSKNRRSAHVVRDTIFNIPWCFVSFSFAHVGGC